MEVVNEVEELKNADGDQDEEENDAENIEKKKDGN